MTYYTTTLATAKNEKLIFTFFDQPYSPKYTYKIQNTEISSKKQTTVEMDTIDIKLYLPKLDCRR